MVAVAPLPTTELAYRERLAFSGTHEKVDQDIIERGGDTGDMEAAFAEMDQERPKEPKDTSFGQVPIQCDPSIYDDERKNISDEFRPMMKCALCQKDPTRISDAPHETRKFYSMTSHVTYQHDARCSYLNRVGHHPHGPQLILHNHPSGEISLPLNDWPMIAGIPLCGPGRR